ncbi:MAG: hypothetical protein QF415_13205 [Candidatus Undinarchaeales archaeon]|jgi:hypothetical protein|nr:hypothetical protein [Candidatus Undinarchaeales archaeon]MDP7493066.1 hypothetical protein [Candidatus Undinarchaeales archaeon]
MYDLDPAIEQEGTDLVADATYKVDDLTMIYGVTRGFLFKKKAFEGEKVRDNVDSIRDYFLENGHGELAITSYMFEIEYADRTSVIVKDASSGYVNVIDKDADHNDVGHYDHHTSTYSSPTVCSIDDIKEIVDFEGAKIKEMQIKFDTADGQVHGQTEVHEHSYMNEALLGVVELQGAGILALTGNPIIGGLLAADAARRVYNTYSKNQKLYLQFEETDDPEIAAMQQQVRDDLGDKTLRNLFLNTI